MALFLNPRQRVARVGGEEERDVLRLGERCLMQQNTLQELGEAHRQSDGSLGRADERKESGGIGATETEPLAHLRLAMRVAAEQHEIAVIGNEHQAVLGEVAGDLLAVPLHREVGRNVVYLDHAALRRLALGPVRRRLAARHDEQAHVGKAGAAVAQVRHAEDTGLQRLAGGVQRAGQRAVIADLARPGAGGVDARDVSEVVGEDAGHDLSLSSGFRFRKPPRGTILAS